MLKSPVCAGWEQPAHDLRRGGFALQRPGETQGRGAAAFGGRRSRAVQVGLPCGPVGPGLC